MLAMTFNCQSMSGVQEKRTRSTCDMQPWMGGLLSQAAIGGHHPGVLTVRKDNDPKRDLKPAGIVRALRNLENANAPIADQFIVLNHYR